MSDGVTRWLEQLDLGKYAEVFAENDIGPDVLPHLTEEHLKELGVSLGDRVRLLKAIEALEATQADVREASPPSELTESVAPTGEAERRQLTVMFCDLVGSTALSSKLDPEDLREVITSFQDKCREAIDRYSGFIARYMGDGMLVYFGYPQAHEDDAERAVRAGLDIVRAMTMLDIGVGKRHEVVLAVRIGVATGSVVVGDIVGEGAAEEAAVVGETPNLAARLQGIAEPNAVVLSAATRHLVAGRFDLEALGPQTLKGIDAPVEAHRALAVRGVSRFDAAHQRRLTPLVGREEELGILLRRWRLAVEGEGQAVLLSGEAGVGKSRIVRALQVAIAEAPANRVFCFCSPYHQSTAFNPLIDQLERATQIRSGQTPSEKLGALQTMLAALELDVDETLRYFAELLSVPYEESYPALDLAPEQLRHRTLDVLVETVEAMAARQPVFFVIEDVHWIDPSTQEFLTRLIERIRTSRTLVVITHRSEFESPWLNYAHVTAFALNNLGRRDAAAMVAEVAKGRSLPESMLEEIIVRADGVPLFIEEITIALGESLLAAGGGEAHGSCVEATFGDIPATLHDLLMERLDRLGAAREAAQLGAVIGRAFTFDVLSAVSDHDEQTLKESLSRLVESGLIYGRGGAEPRYEFKHALVRDAAYQSLLKRERQSCHRRVAAVLLQTADDNLPLELLAHHFGEGGHPEEAARYWRKAGERALAGFAHVEAISNFRRALVATESLPEDDERLRFELDTQTLLGPSLMYVSGQGAPEVEQTYARALSLAEQLDDLRVSFTSAWGMWRLQVARGDVNTGREFALKCRDISARVDDPVAKLGTAFALGETCLFSGDCSAAASHLEDSIALYRGLEDKSALAVFGQDPGLSSLAHLAWARWLLGFPDQAIVPCEEAVQLAREIGKPMLIALTTGFAGLTHAIRRDIPRIIECAEECKMICDRYEFRQHAALSNVILGYAYAHRGDYEQAIALADDGINEKVGLRSNIALPWFCYLAAEAYASAGRSSDAREMARRGIAFASRGAERMFESENHRMLAMMLAQEPDGSHRDIEAHFDDALQLARAQKARSLELRAAVSYARFDRDRGARERARVLLAPIYKSFTEGFDTPDLCEAKTLLKELS